MGEQKPNGNGNGNGNGTKGGPPQWRTAAGTLGGGAMGSAITFALQGAQPIQIVAALAVWSLLTLATVVGYVARMWVERKVVHASVPDDLHAIYRDRLVSQQVIYQELVERIQAAALKRERELEADRDYLRAALGQAANLTATAVRTVVQKGTQTERGQADERAD